MFNFFQGTFFPISKPQRKRKEIGIGDVVVS